MININNKDWDELKSLDIRKFLERNGEENFFFEFKSDNEEPSKLMKEICAFANTYGGYILLGIDDDKSISGCKKWTEQRIHATIHDSITPPPIFSVRSFNLSRKKIYIIKIEEGTNPPYVTNKGQIFERLGSGSFPIKDSYRLAQLDEKRHNLVERVKSKIELPLLRITNSFPQNICGYIDFGFSLTCSDLKILNEDHKNLKKAAELIRSRCGNNFTISRVGNSFQISLWETLITSSDGSQSLAAAGVNTFLEIMFDGSVRGRIILANDSNRVNVNLFPIANALTTFEEIYSTLICNNIERIFVSAHKYQRLTVLRQFVPYYDTSNIGADDYGYKTYLQDHKRMYGGNMIVTSGRIPYYGYSLIDRRTFNQYEVKYNKENLLQILFSNAYFNIGYIDPPNGIDRLLVTEF